MLTQTQKNMDTGNQKSRRWGKTVFFLWGKTEGYPILPHIIYVFVFRSTVMVRTYKRTTNRGSWDPESMKNAVESVLNGEMGYKRAAASFGVPQSTLERKVKIAREQSKEATPNEIFTVTASGTVYAKQNSSLILPQSLGPIKPVFTAEEETLLVNYIFKMEERLFGLTCYDLRILAYKWAEKLGKKHSFSNVKQIAGRDWIQGFKRRHPEVKLRKPEATSATRAAAFNKVNVTKFFDLLKTVVDKYKFTASTIYNCDETGVTVIPKHRSKILALKGRKQVGVLTSAERGNTVTIEVCYNAAGSYMPPMFVFPRARANDQLLNDCPPGAWAEYHPSGWMQSNIFFNWFKKFVKFSRATKESPVLLLLDGHFTHTKNMEVIDFARENGVILLCFPPHCTHRLQPLDVSFMKPLSVYYDQEVSTWLRSNPGRVVSMYQISKLYGNAFIRAATMATALSGFKKTGTWPVNPAVFHDSDYAPSETTDRPLADHCLQLAGTASLQSAAPTGLQPAASGSLQSAAPTSLQPAASTSLQSAAPASLQSASPTSLQPAASASLQFATTTSLQPDAFVTPDAGKNKVPIHSTLPTPEDIVPIPSCSNIELKRRSRKRGKTAVLTESPYKNELQEEINIKKEKETAKQERAKRKLEQSLSSKTKLKGKKNNTKLQKTSTSQSNKKEQNKGENIRSNERKRSRSSSSEEDSDAECLYCGYLYSQSTEGWVQCWKCKKWAHCTCAGEEDEDAESVHLCALCQP